MREGRGHFHFGLRQFLAFFNACLQYIGVEHTHILMVDKIFFEKIGLSFFYLIEIITRQIITFNFEGGILKTPSDTKTNNKI